MALNVEIWKPDILEGLYKDNAFLRHSVAADEYVIDGRIVHIPQAGTAATVSVNRTTLPATVVRRTDTDVIYTLDEFSTDPILIPDLERRELSYDKRQSLIRDNTANMMELVGSFTLFNWIRQVPNNVNRLLMSGTPAVATGSGQTGTRKTLTAADLRAAQALLDAQNIPQEGRYLLLTPEMRTQLMNDPDIKNTFYMIANYSEGQIPMYAGFKIMVRASVCRVSNGSTAVKSPAATDAADDHLAALFWHENMVEKALGNVTIFNNPNRAEYYGDVVSFLIRMGGRSRRLDNKGVGLLIAGAAV